MLLAALSDVVRMLHIFMSLPILLLKVLIRFDLINNVKQIRMTFLLCKTSILTNLQSFQLKICLKNMGGARGGAMRE